MMDASTTEPVASTTEKVHPILKRDPHRHQQDDAPTSSSPPSPSEDAGAAPRHSNRADGESTLDKEKKHLTWDEHAIEEHDLLRGTRMKIEEPDTPYTHYDHPSDEESTSSGHHPRSPDETHPAHATASLAAQWNDVASKLQAVADKRDACPLSPAPSRDSNTSDADMDDEARKQKEQEDKKFKDLRKKHYNEAEMMRRWKEQHANDDEDEDEDDSDEDKMEE